MVVTKMMGHKGKSIGTVLAYLAEAWYPFGERLLLRPGVCPCQLGMWMCTRVKGEGRTGDIVWAEKIGGWGEGDGPRVGFPQHVRTDKRK